MRVLLWFGLLLSVFGSSTFRVATADNLAGQGIETPLEFRRMFVPADHVDDWPIGASRYVPVDPEEFERLIRMLALADLGSGHVATAHLVQAKYHARLAGESILVGQAELEFEKPQAGDVLAPLRPCNLAIDEAKWRSDERGAHLGSASNGETFVLVPRAGQLLLKWSASGNRNTNGAVRFQLELPSSTVSHLEFDLPEELQLSVAGGVVTEQTPLADQMRRWRIQIGNQHRIDLTVAPHVDTSDRRQLALLRQRMTYDVSLRGLEVSAEIELDVHYESLHRLELSLDPSLTPVAARYGDAELSWSSSRESETGGSRMVLEFAEPILGSGRLVQVTASAPSVVGQSWRLPEIRPHGVHWQEGKATLRIRAPLSLVEFAGTRCRQTGASSLPAFEDGEIAEVQMFDPHAAMEIALEIDEEPLHVVSRTVVWLGGSQPISRLVADLSSPKVPRFQLNASVGRGWIIDAVESVPPGSVDQWRVESDAAGRNRLLIRLLEPIRPGELTRLVFKGRRVTPLDGDSLQAGELQMVNFDEAQQEKSLVGLDVADTYRLELRNPERVKVIARDELDPSDSSLFADVPNALLFEMHSADPELTVEVVPKEPQFMCDLRIDADVTESHLIERYLIQCTPLGSTIDTLLVRFSVRHEAELNWSFGPNEKKPLRPRRLTAPEQAAVEDGTSGETWMITLPEPASEPFQIRATRVTPFDGQAAVSLLSLPNAARSSGEVVIHSSDGVPPQIQSQGMEPLPVTMVDPQRYTTARAAFRYDPLSNADPLRTSAVTLTPRNDRSGLAGAICWRCDLVSRYEANGHGQHRVTFDLQNDGMRRWHLRLPDGAELDEVWVDGKKVPRRQQQGIIAIDLPPARRFPTVTLELATSVRPWGITGWAAAPLPVSRDVPLMRRHWTLWMPPEYQVAGTRDSWTDLQPLATTWRQRLFGPFARARASSSVELVDALTRHQFANVMGANWTARDAAEKFLERLGEATSTPRIGTSTPTMTWAELLREVEPARRGAPPLFLDRDALMEAGVDPKTRVPGSSGATTVQRGLSLLERANLALIVQPEALLLTTQSTAASLQHALAPLEYGAVFRTRASENASTVDLQSLRSTQVVAVGDWDVSLRSPWSKTVYPGATALGSAGWRAHEFEGIGWPNPKEMQFTRVVRATQLGAFTWIALLFAAAVSWWWWSRRLRFLAMIVLACGIIALFVPAVYAPIASGAVLGLLFSLGLALLGPVREPTTQKASSKGHSTMDAGTVAVLFLGVGTTFFASTICAADEEGAAPHAIRAPADVYGVLIPIDENREPTGDSYQVPEQFYERLRTLADRAAGTPRGWLLERAVYRGRLASQPSRSGPDLDHLRAEYEVNVFAGARRLWLPLGGDGVDLSSVNVQVDGQAVPVTVTTDPRGLEVPIEGAGLKRVEFELQFAPRSDENPGGLQLTIPPVACSRLELEVPRKGSSVTVPSARGEVVLDETRQTVVASLGPVDVLEIQWQGEPDRGPNAIQPEVEELYWLRVEPGSVVVDAQLRYQFGDRAVDRLQLAVDPRLRLLTPDRARLPIAKRNFVAGDPTVIDLELESPLSGEVLLEVSFLLEGTSGVGNLRFPRIEVRGARSTRRLLGVSVSPSLKYRISEVDVGATLPLADFVQHWGEIEKPPESVYRLPRGRSDWTISTSPNMPAKSVQQHLKLSFGQSGVELFYQADLEITGGPSFQHRLLAPSELAILELSLREAGVERPVRWSRHDDGTITVFLIGPMERRQQIRLHGRLPRPAFGRATVGLVSQVDAEIVSNRLTVFRRPSVLVSVEESSGIDPLEPPSGRPDVVLGRAVADFALRDDVDSLAFSLEPNEPSVNAIQLTSLERSRGTWFARLECQLDVVRGVVDTLRFRLPDDWDGPFTLNPSMETELVELPAAAGRQLVVHPDEPITGRWRLVVRAPVSSQSDEPVRVPRASLVDADRLEQFLLLPEGLNRERLAWSTHAVVRSTMPDGFGPSESDLEGHTCYRVVGDRFEAVLRSIDPAVAVAQVRLADIRMAWDQRGVCQGVAAFDLEPAGEDVCPLWLPSDWQVAGIWIEAVPASARQDTSGQWLLSLSSGRLPQRIEVAFTGRIDPKGSRRQPLQLKAPQLGDLPVERTLWTVWAPPGTSDVELFDGQAVDQARLELVRMETTAGLLRQVVDAPATELQEQTAFWQDAWSRRLAASIIQLQQRARKSPTGLREQLESEVAWAREEYSELLRRMPSGSARSAALAPDPIATQTGEIWTLSAGRSHSRTTYMFQARRETLLLFYRDETRRTEFGRWCAMAALVALAAALSLVRGSGDVSRAIRRNPQTIGVVIGLFWWLWLSPSLLGLLIIVVSLVSAARLGWLRGKPRGSSVLVLDAPSK